MDAFRSLYSHGFVRVASAVPHVRPAEPAFNAERTLALARRASDDARRARHLPRARAARVRDRRPPAPAGAARRGADALERIVAESVGAAARDRRRRAAARPSGGLFNCAIVIHRGRVLGVVPKSYLPEYREYYEKRQFRAARDLVVSTTCSCSARAFRSASTCCSACRDVPAFVRSRRDLRGLLGADPAEHLRRAGGRDRAREPVGEQHHDRQGRLPPAAVRRRSPPARSPATSSPPPASGESTTDLAWDGQALIYENGDLLAEAERFADDEQLITATSTSTGSSSDRASIEQFGDSIHDHRDAPAGDAADRVRARRRRASRSPLRRARRALPVRARRSRQPQRALRGGLQHPGPRARDAPARDRDRARS